MSTGTVELVRGSVGGDLGAEITDFWVGQGLLTPAAAAERLGTVACVLRGADGAIAGVNSVVAQPVTMVAGRTFWVYRSALAAGTDDDDFFSMLSTCFDALAREYEESGAGPVGVAVAVGDPGFLERNPEAIWPRVGFLYAGFQHDGQLRLRYFEGARI